MVIVCGLKFYNKFYNNLHFNVPVPISSPRISIEAWCGDEGRVEKTGILLVKPISQVCWGVVFSPNSNSVSFVMFQKLWDSLTHSDRLDDLENGCNKEKETINHIASKKREATASMKLHSLKFTALCYSLDCTISQWLIATIWMTRKNDEIGLKFQS